MIVNLTNIEVLRFKQWVIENVDSTVVPADSGNSEELVINLVSLLEEQNS